MYGSLITTLEVNLDKLDKGFDEALKRARKYRAEIDKLTKVEISGGMAGTAGARAAVGGTTRQGVQAARQIQQDQRDTIRLRQMYQKDEVRQEQQNTRDRLRDAARRKRDQTEQRRDDQDHIRQRLAILNQGSKDFEASEKRRAAAVKSAMQEVYGRGGSEGDQRRIQNESVKQARSLRSEFDASGGSVRRLGGFIDRFGRASLKGLQEDAKRVRQAFSLIFPATALAGVATFIKAGIDLNRVYETQKTSIAEILALNTRLVDSRGKDISQAKEIKENYAEAADLIKKVREESFRTVLTAPQLIQAFQQTFAFGLRAKEPVKPERLVPLIGRIANLATALGAQGERELGFETRALMTGQMVQRSRIGRALGLTPEEIKNARATGDIIDFLNRRLAAGQPYVDNYRKSFAGLMTTLVSKGQEFIRLSFQETFQKITKGAGDLNKYLTPERIKKWADNLSSGLVTAYDALDHFVKSDAFKNLFSLFKFMFAHADVFLTIFAGFKAMQVTAATRQVFKNLGGQLLLEGGKKAAPKAITIAKEANEVAAGAGFFAGLKFIGQKFAGKAGVALASTGAVALQAVPLAAGVAGIATLGTLSRQTGAAQQQERQTLQEMREQARTRPRARLAQQLNAARANRRRREGELEEATRQFDFMGSPERMPVSIGGGAPVMRSLESFRQQALLARRQETALEKAAGRQEGGPEGETRHVRMIRDNNKINDLLKQQIALDKILGRRKKDDVDALHAALSAEILNAKKIFTNKNFYQKATHALYEQYHNKRLVLEDDDKIAVIQTQGEIAENRGKTIQKLLLDDKEYRAEKLKLLHQDSISEAEFQKLTQSHTAKTNREIIKQRQDAFTSLKQLQLREVDLVRDTADKRKNILREILDAERNYAKEQRQFIKERRDAEHSLTEALRSEKEARQNLEFGGATRQERDAFRKFASTQREGTRSIISGGVDRETLNQYVAHDPTIQEQLEKRFSRETRQQYPDLAGGDRLLLTTQKVTDEIRSLSDMIVGPDGLNKVIERLKELGVNLTPDQRRDLAGFGARATMARQTREGVEEARTAEGEQRAATDATRAVTDAQDHLKEVNQRAAEAAQAYTERQTKLQEELSNASREYQRALIDLAKESHNVAEAFRGIGGGRPAAIDAAFSMPAFSRLGRGSSKFVGVGLPRGIAGPPTPLELMPDRFQMEHPAVAVQRYSEAHGSAVAAAGHGGAGGHAVVHNHHYDLGKLQIGHDTKETLDRLGKQLQRDSRRTP